MFFSYFSYIFIKRNGMNQNIDLNDKENPISKVTVCLMDEEDRMLVLFDKAKEEWVLPNWDVDINHSAIEAAEQMVHELLGVNIDLDEGDSFFRAETDLDDQTKTDNVYYVIEGWDGEIKNMHSELYSKIEWFDGENLDANILNPMTLQAYEMLNGDEEYDDDHADCC